MATKFVKLMVCGMVSVSLTLSGVSAAKASTVKSNHQKQEVKVEKPVKHHDEDDDENEVEINSTIQDYRKSKFKLEVEFDKDLNRKTVNTKNIHLTKVQVKDEVKNETTSDKANKDEIVEETEAKDVAIKVRLSSDKEDIIVTLKEDLEPNSVYTLSLSGIKDLKGNTLEDKEFEIKTVGKNFSDEIEEVDDFEGKVISPSSIKWTWEYDEEDEENIDGFILYDEEGNQLTEVGDITSDQREYVQEGLTLKSGEKYKIEIAAYKLSDEVEEGFIEGEREDASVKVKK